MERYVLTLCLLYRMLNLLLVQTWFVPDEYYQSVEPAHALVFGYGQLTWEWRQGLRSSLYPSVISVVFWLLKLLHLDTRWTVVFAPRIMQVLLSSLGDIYLFKLCKRFLGERPAFWTLKVWWASWFAFFCGTRTLINTVECNVNLMAFYYYPWPQHMDCNPTTPGKSPKLRGLAQRRQVVWQTMYLSLAVVLCIVRPTAVLFWAPLILWQLWLSPKRLAFIFKTCVPIGFPILMLSLVIDRVFYGGWVFSAWNFLSFNVLSGGSAHFGVHPWHWYLTVGIPTVFGVHILPITLGILRQGVGAVRLKPIGLLCLWYVTFYSLLAHKEQRFLLPILPLMCMYAGDWMHSVARPSAKVKHTSPHVKKGHDMSPLTHYWRFVSRKAKLCILLLYVANLPVALYTGLIHQRGVLDVTHSMSQWANSIAEESYWVLAPCHSIPLYSHIHINVPIMTLGCDPNLAGVTGYIDEADLFYSDPIKWLNTSTTNLPQPSKVVMFETLWDKVGSWFTARNYDLCGQKIFNTHFPQGSRQSEYLVVEHNCNGTVVDHSEYGEVIQLTGDQRQNIKDFICKVGIVKADNCKLHGF